MKINNKYVFSKQVLCTDLMCLVTDYSDRETQALLLCAVSALDKLMPSYDWIEIEDKKI